MSQSRPGVLFDVDGTLVDSNYLHTLAWSRALADAGEWAPMNAIHRLVGMGGDQLIPELLGHPCPLAEKARGERYRALQGDLKAFPRAGDLLREVHGAGLATVLATSSPQGELDGSLALIDAGEALDAVTTADDVSASKPAPDLFLTALEAGSVDPARALVVGDSVWDVQAARDAGLGCIGVESGGFSHHELINAGALAVYRHVGELCAQVWTSPIALLLR